MSQCLDYKGSTQASSTRYDARSMKKPRRGIWCESGYQRTDHEALDLLVRYLSEWILDFH